MNYIFILILNVATNFFVRYVEKKTVPLMIPSKRFDGILIFFNINAISIFVIPN